MKTFLNAYSTSFVMIPKLIDFIFVALLLLMCKRYGQNLKRIERTERLKQNQK